LFIKNCLTAKKEIVTVTPDTNAKELFHTLETNQLDSIPVIDMDGHFLGITGYSYVMKSLINRGFEDWEQLTVRDALHVMEPLAIDSDFEKTLPVIVRYPFVPIVAEDNRTFLGIVKISDIEAVLTDTYGHKLPGVRFLLAVIPDLPRELEHLMNAISDFEVNIISVVTFDAGDSAARRILLKIHPTSYTDAIRRRLEEKGFRVLNVKEITP